MSLWVIFWATLIIFGFGVCSRRPHSQHLVLVLESPCDGACHSRSRQRSWLPCRGHHGVVTMAWCTQHVVGHVVRSTHHGQWGSWSNASFDSPNVLHNPKNHSVDQHELLGPRNQCSFVYPCPSVSDFARRNPDHGPSKTQTETQTTPDNALTSERRNSDHGLNCWEGKLRPWSKFGVFWGRGRWGGSQENVTDQASWRFDLSLFEKTLWCVRRGVWGNEKSSEMRGRG